jgi:hypothetical protein
MDTVQSQIIASGWVAPDGDASGARQVTLGTSTYDGVGGLAWAPDGRLMCPSNADGNLNNWTAGPDGSNPRQLTFSNGFHY